MLNDKKEKVLALKRKIERGRAWKVFFTCVSIQSCHVFKINYGLLCL